MNIKKMLKKFLIAYIPVILVCSSAFYTTTSVEADEHTKISKMTDEKRNKIIREAINSNELPKVVNKKITLDGNVYFVVTPINVETILSNTYVIDDYALIPIDRYESLILCAQKNIPIPPTPPLRPIEALERARTQEEIDNVLINYIDLLRVILWSNYYSMTSIRNASIDLCKK